MDYILNENKISTVKDTFDLISDQNSKEIWGLTAEGTGKEAWTNDEYFFDIDGEINNNEMLRRMDQYLLNISILH